MSSMFTVPLFRFKTGDHICVFYRDDAYMLELLTSYIAQGLRNDEQCFCAQRPCMQEQLKAALMFAGIDVSAEIRRGSLDIHTVEEVYFGQGMFGDRAMIDLLQDAITRAKTQGFRGLRAAGEMSWAANGKCNCDQLLQYEAMVNETFPDRPAIGLCQYDMRCFREDVLARVLERHCCALAQLGSTQSIFTIRHSGYSTDIVADRINPKSQFYYVAQPYGSKEVVGWGAEETFDDAVVKAKCLLDQLCSVTTRQPSRKLRVQGVSAS